MFFRLLPWEYAIRNLFRRPLRTFLTCAVLTTVVVLVFVVVGFIRGLERSLAVSGDHRTAIVFSLGMGKNLEYSSIPMRTSDVIDMRERLSKFEYDDVYGYTWGRNIVGGGKEAVEASYDRYLAAVNG